MRQFLFFTLALLVLPLAAQNVGDTENGQASYYSREYQGAKTAYNVIYDRDDLVAAHRQYPLNSVIRVTNLDNNKSVNVRVIDKGPFIRGRIVELSERAAALLGMIGKESVPAEVTLVALPGDTPAPAPTTANRTVAPPRPYTETSTASRPGRDTPSDAPASPPETSSQSARVAETSVEPSAPQSTERDRSVAAQPAPEQTPPATRPGTPEPTVRPTAEARREVKSQPVSTRSGSIAKDFKPGTYRITVNRATPGKYGVQVGSYSDLATAMDKVVEMQSRWFDDVMIHYSNNAGVKLYKVIVGSFDTDKSAVRYRDDMKKRYKIDGFTVRIE